MLIEETTLKSVFSMTKQLPPNLSIKIGDILQSTDDVLVHQCHCCNVDAGGLAKLIFEKYPCSNVYQTRYQESRGGGVAMAFIEPGTVGVYEIAPNAKKYVVNLYAQIYPGPPTDSQTSLTTQDDDDSSALRLELFEKCLKSLSKVNFQSSVNQPKISFAFPWRIGCGIALGDWYSYLKSIVTFCFSLPNCTVVLYQKVPEGQQSEKLPKGWVRPRSQSSASKLNTADKLSQAAIVKPQVPRPQSVIVSPEPSTFVPTNTNSQNGAAMSKTTEPTPEVRNVPSEESFSNQLTEVAEKERAYWKFIINRMESDHREQMAQLQSKFQEELKQIQTISSQQVHEIEERFLSVSRKLCNEQEQKQRAIQAKDLAQQKLAEGIKKLEMKRRKYKSQIRIDSNIPEYWQTDYSFISQNRRVTLNPSSEEYQVVAGLMGNFREIGKTKQEKDDIFFKRASKYVFRVLQIERLENRQLWDAYCFERQKLIDCYKRLDPKDFKAATIHQQRRHESLVQCELRNRLAQYPMLTPCHDTDPENPVNEYWLFHGTDWNTVDNYLAIAPGYDPRMGSGLFGHGFYLAEDARKSFLYTKCRHCGEFQEICKCTNENVARILVYRAVLGNAQIIMERTDEMQTLRRPGQDTNLDLPYDSVLVESMSNVPESSMLFREIILYEKFKAYPEYIITIQRQPNDGRMPQSSSTWAAILGKAKAFIAKRNAILNAEK